MRACKTKLIRLPGVGGRLTVYQLANRLAAIPTSSEKIGTPTAKTNAAPLSTMIKTVQTPHPMTVCSCRWVLLRKRRTKKSFAEVCAYNEPAMRKLGSAMPYVAFCHLTGKLEKAGLAAEGPR